jgi:hypothetical protein
MDHPEVLTKSVVDQAKSFLTRWSNLYPKGKTWVGKEFGVPSLFVRLDFVVDGNGELQVYEAEDRPCGIGIGFELIPAFRQRFSEFMTQWPQFSWVVAPERTTDDELWLGGGISLEQAHMTDGLLLVRSRPESAEYHPLEPRAVSTVQHEGDKRCCVQLGMAEIIRWVHDLSDQNEGYILPPISGPCVIKPLQGTRSRLVEVALNGLDISGKAYKRRKDTIGISGLENRLKRHGPALCQPFIFPMLRAHLPGMNVIYRFFFAYSPRSGGYEPVGGVWMALDSLIVHGDNTAISGPLDFEG